ncbi:hypothetical protein PQI23_05440 [Leucobacter sp. USCH14]|uniref:hypothetical protein n=1 Tax=Leucobacter sp. USCH14 TaxID=3024838 RepID=UPI0030ACF105
MNATHRGVNRTVLLVVGVVLIAGGAVAAAAALVPDIASVWRSATESSVRWMRDAATASRLTEATPVSWFAIAVLAALLAIVVVAVIIVARLGGGRSSTVLREEARDGAQGAVTIGHGFAADALTGALANRSEILSSRVAARKVRGVDVLHVKVTPRQRTSPRDVAELVGQLADNLAVLTGRETPMLLSIRSGIRSRVAASESRVR